MERVGVKAATNPVRLLQASTSTDSATKTALHPRIKSFGPGCTILQMKMEHLHNG